MQNVSPANCPSVSISAQQEEEVKVMTVENDVLKKLQTENLGKGVLTPLHFSECQCFYSFLVCSWKQTNKCLEVTGGNNPLGLGDGRCKFRSWEHVLAGEKAKSLLIIEVYENTHIFSGLNKDPIWHSNTINTRTSHTSRLNVTVFSQLYYCQPTYLKFGSGYWKLYSHNMLTKLW